MMCGHDFFVYISAVRARIERGDQSTGTSGCWEGGQNEAP